MSTSAARHGARTGKNEKKGRVANGKVIIPTFRLEPGDGSGCSLEDARVRNTKGICAIFGCGNPLSIKNYWVVGYVCDDCDEKYEKFFGV
jgi:hypothetical protein